MQERTGEFFPGSPFNALMVKPPFREYHYIDMDRKKIDELEKLAGFRKDIKIYHGDCNKVLLNKVLPCAKYSDFRRALRKVAYEPSPQMGLFGEVEERKVSNETIAEAFRSRLNKVAGFKNVPKPIAMRNTQNAVVYYLFFASHKPVAEGIVKDIFKKYKNRRG